MAYLEVHTGSGLKRFDISSGKVSIGRHASNVVVIENDNLISRFHCEILKTDRGYLLRDLKSSNGTVVGGKRIGEFLLLNNVAFTIGNTKLAFVNSGLADKTSSDRSGAVSPDHKSDPVNDLQTQTGDAMVMLEDRMDQADAQPQDESNPELPAGDELFASDMTDPDPVVTGPQFKLGSIDSLTQIGHEVPFELTDLEMINARGQAVHTANARKSTTAETILLMRVLLYGAARCGASDIHLEPRSEGALVRMRIDGAMVEVSHMTPEMVKRLQSLVKVLCDVDITKKTIVQEGHFSSRVPGRWIDYRVSFTPAMFGQKMVVRVLDPFNCPQSLRDLSMPDWMYTQIRDTARRDTGMVLVSGPTGSGKTTTLYAALRQIDAKLRNVITIEDPIEYEVEGVTQIPVDENQGQTFHSLLRSCLRQDPDVIVLGEIRDRETAVTAMQAATTGHLVLSTVHAKDTIGTIFRLLDLGAEPYLVASTINLILAQRLARMLCPKCKEPGKPSTQEVMRLKRSVEGIKEIYKPVGCTDCFGTGYSGRRAIFELLTATDELRDVILNKPNIASIKRAIEISMFRSLRDFGIDLIINGQTSMDEVNRVIGID